MKKDRFASHYIVVILNDSSPGTSAAETASQ